jgi:hypothetical protein
VFEELSAFSRRYLFTVCHAAFLEVGEVGSGDVDRGYDERS